MRDVLHDHRRALFVIVLTAVPLLVVAAFRWRETLHGFAAVLGFLLVLKAASVFLSVAVRLVLR